MIGERFGDQRLRAAAVATPGTSELNDRSARQGIDFGTRRILLGIALSERHARISARSVPPG
jgi:hypothetical protein